MAQGGNIASSLFNAVFGNLLGIFVTPLLIFKFLGTSQISVPYLAILKKLTSKVSRLRGGTVGIKTGFVVPYVCRPSWEKRRV